METSWSRHRDSFSLPALFFWLGVGSIALLLFVVSGHFSAFARFTVPMAELQRMVISSSDHREVRAVIAEGTARSEATDFQFHLINRLRNQTAIRKIGEKQSKRQKVEEGLARARASIRKAALAPRNIPSSIVNGTGVTIYRNPGEFYQSYTEMERRLKVYVYEDGEPPITHDGPCKNIYSIEGRFIGEMEHSSSGKRFRTWDAEKAHVYFMPFSVTWMVKYMYTPGSYDQTPLKQFVSDYVTLVSAKYPFWNSTQGAHHFMLSCHDWGPMASEGNSNLHNISIRVLCNANTSEGFNPQKDVSLPEIPLYGGHISPILISPPPAATPRPHLAFFSGGLHGPIRPLLLQHWKARDPELPVYEYLPKGRGDPDYYYSFMLKSKYCLCPSGHEVASPRIVEAIYAECVPVIISKGYVLPFSDVLRWEAFSVQVEPEDIPRLKEILKGVSEDKYKRLVEGVRAVRKHFVLNQPAKRFDAFHMILHSVWLRRLNLRLG